MALSPVKVASDATKGGALLALGSLGYILGLGIEVVADWQKSRFKSDKSNPNRHKWCDIGLWKYSRHPNYLGEILIWWSIFVMSQPTAPFWSILSPIFVTGLISFVSGIPLLEAKYESKFGNDTEYQQYKQKTPILFPGVFRRN
eukprot:CAMPEP_0114535976 /NCGR_PEP_ID=MMETSP0109-20121206/28738_1 /TAXON_ID=29199 /ORGANISM="Chlorarachnion reptans, Strain CCCM449" /LENGTH=143 /DNA_ID=CAMNT_0001719647 /DNA_START=429 /DNA_END=860 /DNA_ORIENTATION=-